ncbi:MAG TPA: hypothetical protein VE553_05305 [Candidatus Binatia bacterium]|nr:hypothetical protein [Candidatus Binatia bacterium]
MKRLQIAIMVLVGWLFFFYNIERLSEPINIASFVYVLVALSCVFVMITPVYQFALQWIFAGILPIYAALKLYLGYPFFGANLPITVTELVAIGVTLVLSRTVMREVFEAREAVAKLTLSQLREGFPFEVGQSLIYREIRRARINDRPLALLSIAPNEDSLATAIDRFVREAQEEIMKRYVDARIADMLLEELHDFNIVTQRNDHFIALLAETDQDSVQRMIEHLRTASVEKLGVQLKIGHAIFPSEAVTFEQLIANAEQRMLHPNGNEQDGERLAAETATLNT